MSQAFEQGRNIVAFMRSNMGCQIDENLMEGETYRSLLVMFKIVLYENWNDKSDIEKEQLINRVSIDLENSITSIVRAKNR